MSSLIGHASLSLVSHHRHKRFLLMTCPPDRPSVIVRVLGKLLWAPTLDRRRLEFPDSVIRTQMLDRPVLEFPGFKPTAGRMRRRGS